MPLSLAIVKQMRPAGWLRLPANSRLDNAAGLDDSATLKFMKKILLFIGGIVLAAHLAQCQSVAPPAGSFTGQVLETTNAANYTYVLVDTGSKKVWAATTQFEVHPGQSVAFMAGEPMVNFHSRSMNRDFSEIYFVGAIAVNGAAAAAKLPPGHPDISGAASGGTKLPPNHPPIAGQTAPLKVDFSNLQPVAGGKTIAEIFTAASKLNGKSVTVRGKVVKYNAAIMGKNWVHIQDGTGQPGSDDLLATSSAATKVGDTVLVAGKVATKKDFGAGYKYDVMIEDAKLVVE